MSDTTIDFQKRLADRYYNDDPNFPYPVPIVKYVVDSWAKANPIVADNISYTELKCRVDAANKAEIERFDSARKAYHEACALRHSAFQVDMCAYHGVDMHHPIIQACLAQSWETGHSAGFAEVACHFADTLDKFQPIIKAYNLVPKS